ncbi:MAG: RNA-binding protein, partial [Fusobacterium sp.]
MDKKGFLKIFKESDEYIISSLWNDIELCEEIEVPVFTKEFYPPAIWNYLEKNNINGLKFICMGLNSESEKK